MTCLHSIWLFLYLWAFGRYNFCDDGAMGWFPSQYGDMFTKYINKACDGHAITMLAACYLPGHNFFKSEQYVTIIAGVLAGYIQLIRGTKYSWFPSWLDSWMRMRKYLGLFMLLSASIHGCLYMLMYTPHPHMMKIPSPVNQTVGWDWSKMVSVSMGAVHPSLQGNVYLGAGVIAYFVAVILGLTSLPSVEASLSWLEFRMIQSRLGWFCLILATVHVMANGWQKLLKFDDCIFLGNEQIALILPLITLVLKVPLLLPCLDWRLTRIRAGREYSSLCG